MVEVNGMKKQIMILMALALVFVLAACGGNQTSIGSGSDSGGSPNGSSSGADLTTCTVQSQALPDLASENDHIIGKEEDYSITIIAYNDFSCAGCLTIAQALDKSLDLYPEDVRLVYRHFPVIGGENDNGIVAAKSTEAAGKQGKFWEMHDFFFATQDAWIDMDPDTFTSYIYDQVDALGMDPTQFGEDVNSKEISELIAQQYDEALNFRDAPPLVLVEGTVTPPYLSTIQDFFLWLETLMIPYGRHIKSQQFAECPPMIIDEDESYTATLHTTKGDIVLALYPDAAPVTVNNFIFLAENDYYDETPFYAVIEGFVAQAGDPSGTGWGTPGFLYGLEVSPEVNFDRPYMLAMANSGPEASNSQFFISFSPLTYLNGKHTVFGEVIDGVDVLKALDFRDPEKDPISPMTDLVLDITIEQQ
jgi:cyclophilin family peptidyl-prolyl cis-trans isomerase